MASAAFSRPEWQTEDLDEEWIEEDSQANYSMGTQSISLTTPLPGFVQTSIDQEDAEIQSPTESSQVGTFLIREDMPAVALLPKTPGKQNKKGAIKDFFSPLALEKMFEPPSPPAAKPGALAPYTSSAPIIPSRLSQAFTPDDSTQTEAESDVSRHSNDRGVGSSSRSPSSLSPAGFGAHKSSMDCQFTFNVPRLHPPTTGFPQAESTPGNVYSAANPPMTDPRLRLFQLQYDTFTRDHLSAMVDSIAVNTPSAGSAETSRSPTSFGAHGFSKTREVTVSDDSAVRSIKRIKLSPPTAYYGEGDGAGATIARPKVIRRDYVGESRSLMEQIKQARDFSTISTTAGSQSPATHATSTKSHMREDSRRVSQGFEPSGSQSRRGEKSKLPTNASGSIPQSTHSSLAYRLQAANLMEQIKNDMKGSKRLFSADTDISLSTHAEDTSAAHQPSLKGDHSQVSTWSEEKENQSHRKYPSMRRPSSSRRQQPSPRKPSRSYRSDDADRSLAHELSNMSIDAPWQDKESPRPRATAPAILPIPHIRVSSAPDPDLLVPPTHIAPSYPSSSIRSGTNEDLNRFVSSSTASGTTMTTSSVPSFVKHAGPVQITHIAPSDIPSLPERVGKMVYDKDLMKWVRSTARSVSATDDQPDHTVGTDVDAESEDPFRDIESLREDDSGGPNDDRPEIDDTHDMDEHDAELDVSRIEEDGDGELDDQEEVDLTSFSFDGHSVAAIRIIPTDDESEVVMEEDDHTTDSDSDDNDDVVSSTAEEVDLETEDEFPHQPQPLRPANSPNRSRPAPSVIALATPIATRNKSSIMATPMPTRSALKSTSATPVSALKNVSRDKYRTPAQRLGHRRSVSFSDGKRDGPIRGLGVRGITPDDYEVSLSDGDQVQGSLVPSARSKRLADMMHDLENTDLDDEGSPTKSTSSGRPPTEELQPLGHRRPSSQVAVSGSVANSSRRVSSMSQRSRIVDSKGMQNATFLTEWSFGLAHDKLVQVITDMQPFEPYWEELNNIDLTRKTLDSVARLKEFLPKLDSLILNHNQLSWLSGIPATVRTLSVASNFLTGVTAFSHLSNLENLDISNNDIDSLTQLQCLRHLRELRADGNKITSIDGLQKMDGLVKLSLQDNQLREADLTSFRWSRLEMLNLSHNRLTDISSLAMSLPALVALNIDNNMLDHLEPGGSMSRLRILRVSGNRLRHLNVAPFPNLRTLYVDNNSLATLVKAERLAKLENLSMRNQSCRDFNLSTRQFRDVKRLYLSGNKLRADFIEEPCYNLVYLEAAACRLTSLPRDLSRLVPNLRVLNLNYNFLEEAQPLEGLTRLKKLTIIGSRLKGTKPLIRVLQRMPDAEMLDFRMNPCTLGWYLPLLVRDVPGALQPSENNSGGSGGDGHPRGEKTSEYGWQELDSKFRRDLPDDAYVGRLAYRGLVMRACPHIRMLDGVEVSEKERAKANHLLQGIMGKNKIKGKDKILAGSASARDTS
ncbi:hypothetical protein BJ138DRAFT_1146190 [Hygrophoropsis aurantiaca]|uniref:Uncharacterized protein n=1 Tax=Hygrophoropsis aurantiaca TaxID=72124 RepID=A0ACB8AIS5_9AGAM|nr:hypothetical protein BJ138DRAFT_1146190 [Hygrophoropsis aurantiaca]